MNLIRQAGGARRLNYLGLSYGTGLGAVYANLFPATVGHMVLDGNLNPVAWTRGGDLPLSRLMAHPVSAGGLTVTYADVFQIVPPGDVSEWQPAAA
jgi:pimeloyl-ACP methyl ester carboxylesterase